MRKWTALLCALLALGLVAAGCGGDDDDGGDGGGSGAAPATTEQQPAAQDDTGGGAEAGGDAVKVSMKDIAFDPGEVTVPKGGTVTWTNDDSVGHDVTKTDGPGKAFKSGDAGAMASGDSFSQRFTTAGTIEYVCTVHPGMEGTVVVK